MARETMREIMSEIDGATGARFIANNTVAYWKENGDRVIRLHHTDIVTFRTNGDVVLNSGGWLTYTTKERMNRHVPTGWRIWSDKGVWYIGHRFSSSEEGRVFFYHDEMTIHPDNTTDAAPFNREQEKEAARLRRKIRTYARNYMKLARTGELGAPGPGDCFYCQMRERESGRPIGDVFQDQEHLLSHIEEKYYVPSMLWNAAVAIGTSRASHYAMAYAFGQTTERSWMLDIGFQQLETALYRYLCRQLGRAIQGAVGDSRVELF